MEVVILNGITQTAATGLPKTAEGLNALMQRAYNRICLKRGAFCYDRVLGSRFYMLDAADEHAEERALRYAQDGFHTRVSFLITTNKNKKINRQYKA